MRPSHCPSIESRVARSTLAPCIAMLGALVLGSGAPLAQQPAQTVHLNPVIARLAAGKTVYGLSTGDLSLPNARGHGSLRRSTSSTSTWSTTRSTFRRCTCS